MQRPTTSVSEDFQLLKALEDEDTEETPVLQGSPCASPVLRKSSTLSSFISAAGYRDCVEDETTGRWKRRKYGHIGEEELRLIQQKAVQTKQYMLELTSRLRNRADLVKNSSLSASMETKALREYVLQLGGRLDRLVTETEETEREVSGWVRQRNSAECRLEGKEERVRCSCFL